MMVAAPPAPVHWTTYVQTFAVIASTIGTFVYVYFTYHIMKWAVGQGKATMKAATLTLEDERLRREKWLADASRFTSETAQSLELAITGMRIKDDAIDVRSRLTNLKFILQPRLELIEEFVNDSSMPERILRPLQSALSVGEAVMSVVNGRATFSDPEKAREALPAINLFREELQKAAEKYAMDLRAVVEEGGEDLMVPLVR